jgi:hypothetical protein
MPDHQPQRFADAPIAPRNPRTALIAYAATNLDAPPRYNATNAVHCRGKRLSRIIWRGQQWAATAYGIECRDGTYSIAKTCWTLPKRCASDGTGTRRTDRVTCPSPPQSLATGPRWPDVARSIAARRDTPGGGQNFSPLGPATGWVPQH